MLSNYETEIPPINGGGTITSSDAITIFRCLSGIDMSRVDREQMASSAQWD